jgi:hypothetical protein
MKYGLSINQYALYKMYKNEITVNEALLFDVIRAIIESYYKFEYKIDNKKIYVWISTKLIQNAMPILPIGDRQIKAYIARLAKLGLVETHPDNQKCRKLFICLGKRASEVVFAKEGSLSDNADIVNQKNEPATMKETSEYYEENFVVTMKNPAHNDLIYNDRINDDVIDKEKTHMFKTSLNDNDGQELFEEDFTAVGSNKVASQPKPTIFSFEQFWNMYDKKLGREICDKKYKKLNETERQKIKEHLPKYCLSTPDKQYRKNPITYLNQKCWNDDVLIQNLPKTAEKEKELYSSPF